MTISLCFKNALTMNIVFRSPVIAGSHATYDDKIQFWRIFRLKPDFQAHLSCSLCQKPSFPVDVMPPFGH